ncbi:hypothetical protein J4403_01585 [Candidatus Woesearchaeota archaeon]|nr:hypothetical protein [Candidatus Woesearchaeota archaeon]
MIQGKLKIISLLIILIFASTVVYSLSIEYLAPSIKSPLTPGENVVIRSIIYNNESYEQNINYFINSTTQDQNADFTAMLPPNQNYTIFSTLNFTYAGNYSLKLIITSNESSAEQEFNLTITGLEQPSNTAPNITSTPILTAIEDQVYTYLITITDDGSYVLNLIENPSGMNLNEGTLIWTPNNEQALNSPQTVKIQVNDSDYSIEQEFNISVEWIDDKPIFSGNIQNITTNEDEYTNLNLSLYFSDEENSSLNYYPSTISQFTISINNLTSIAQIKPFQDYCGSQSIRFYCSDGSNETQSNLFYLDVACINDLPNITSTNWTNTTDSGTSNEIYTGLGNLTLNAEATDAEGQVWYNWFVNSILKFFGKIFVFSGKDYGEGNYNITLIVNDSENSQVLQEFNVTVVNDLIVNINGVSDNGNYTGLISLTVDTNYPMDNISLYYQNTTNYFNGAEYVPGDYNWVLVGTNSSSTQEFRYTWNTTSICLDIYGPGFSCSLGSKYYHTNKTKVKLVINDLYSYILSDIEMDSSKPEAIDDLSAEPYLRGFPNKEDAVKLNWTQSADDESSLSSYSEAVSYYKIKYSLSPITTETEFNNAYDIKNSNSAYEPYIMANKGELYTTSSSHCNYLVPGSEQTCYVYNLSEGGNKTYYFAIRAVDNVGLESDLETLPPYYTSYSVAGTSVYSDVGMSELDYTHKGESHTYYLGNQINFTFNVTNYGNINVKNITSYFRLSPSTILETKNFDLNIGETKEITYEYNISHVYPDSDFDFYAYLDRFDSDGNEIIYYDMNSSNDGMKSLTNLPIYSIQNNITFNWSSETEYPQATESKDNSFWIDAAITNNLGGVSDMHNLPAQLNINSLDYTILDIWNGNYSGEFDCSVDKSKCWFMLPTLTTDSISWNVTINQTGTYNISVILGDYPEDQQTISRLVNIV